MIPDGDNAGPVPKWVLGWLHTVSAVFTNICWRLPVPKAFAGRAEEPVVFKRWWWFSTRGEGGSAAQFGVFGNQEGIPRGGRLFVPGRKNHVVDRKGFTANSTFTVFRVEMQSVG